MKKYVVCVALILLFCGGLFALHLVAQSEKTEASVKTKISLLDPKMEECCERELLELKIKSCREVLHLRDMANLAGTEEGQPHRVADARANLAAAEAELYRHTGERDKLLAALKAKVDALRDKLRTETQRYLGELSHKQEVCTAEIQLLDALLEQKRTREPEQ